MKKYFIFIILSLFLLTITSCETGASTLEKKEIYEYEKMVCFDMFGKGYEGYKEHLAALRDSGDADEFAYNKWLKGTLVTLHEGDYIVGTFSMKYDALSSSGNHRNYVYTPFKFIKEHKMISDEDIEYVEETIKKEDKYNLFILLFVYMEAKLRIVLMNTTYLDTYAIFDCTNDLHLMDAIQEMSEKYDYDITSELIRRSSVLYNPDNTYEERNSVLEPINIYMQESSGYMQFLTPPNVVDWEGDYLFTFIPFENTIIGEDNQLKDIELFTLIKNEDDYN